MTTQPEPFIALIVAMGENRVIGRDNGLPWHVPEDLKRFRALTTGKPVIMGRKTFESVLARNGRPLPGRANIVISRSDFKTDGAAVFPGLPEALDHARALAKRDGLDEIFVIGGAQIYEQALALADRIYLTEVKAAPQGDAFFPALDPAIWTETSSIPYPGDPPCTFKILDHAESLSSKRRPA